jgi:phosphoribosylanthranilate isomerase
MTRVKICGLTDPLAFDTAVDAGADWVGFNFFPPSPRFITPQAAATLAERRPGGPPCVGLFVEPSDDAVAQVLDKVRLDALQIYGVADRLALIRTRFGLPVWRPVGVSIVADLPTETLGADVLLMEAKPPAGSDRPGGNATTFDWSILRGWKAPAPWILAGGLTPSNVAQAIRETSVEAVDVSSGVERQKGIKDPDLIKAFIAAAKAAR